MNASPTSMSLMQIDDAARDYRAARNTLCDRVQSLQEEIAAITRRRLPGIKAAAADAAHCQSTLRGYVEGEPELFVKPRTMTLHGIKLGFQKGKGSIDWDDDEQLAKAIRKHHPEQFDVFVQTKHKPLAKALESLSAAELKRLGCTVEDSGDHVIIKDASDLIDKLVAKLLEEGATPVEGVS